MRPFRTKTVSSNSLFGRLAQDLSRAWLRGTLVRGETNQVRDLVFQANVKVADIKKIQPGKLPDTLKGTIRLKGVVSGKRESADFRIHADLKALKIKIPDVINKPEGMPASFNIQGKLQDQRIITLDQATLTLPHLAFSGKGTFDTGDPYSIKANVESTPISLASIPEDVLFGIKKFQSGELTLALDVEGEGTDWRAWEINGSGELRNAITENDSPDDPIHQVSVEVSLTQGQDELRFIIEAIRIKNILPFLGIAQYPFEGTVWANGVLRGRIEPDQELLPTISGNMEILTKEGIIHGEAVLAKILSLVNFPSLISGDVEFDQDNIPFDSITADIDVAKGILHTENYVLQSPTILLSGVGKYDLPADQMDFVIAVSPFGSFTNLIEDIPLINRLFGAKLLTVFFEVKGPAKNPDIRPLPLEAIEVDTRNLFNQSVEALKGTVSSPQKEEE